MEKLFRNAPDGTLKIPNLQEALDRIADLERRLTELEAASDPQ